MVLTTIYLSEFDWDKESLEMMDYYVRQEKDRLAAIILSFIVSVYFRKEISESKAN